MPSALLPDPAPLFQPLPGDAPAGQDLRYEPIWDEIEQARKEQDNSLVLGAPPKKGEWAQVVELVSEALRTRTKDLRLATYLTEALVRLEGYAGLTAGLQVVRGLIDGLWEPLHPQIAGDSQGTLERRQKAVREIASRDVGMRIPNWLREVRLVPTVGDGPVLSFNYRQSLSRAPQRLEKEKDGEYSARQKEWEDAKTAFEEGMQQTPTEYYADLWRRLKEARAEVTALDASLRQKFGGLSPGTVDLQTALKECDNTLVGILKSRGDFPPGSKSVKAEPGEESGGSTNGDARAAGGNGPIRNRHDAVERLKEVAKYFRTEHPDSPIPLLVDRAVRWSEMKVEELVPEFVKFLEVLELKGKK
jgi:type VI secretion system protein ImpA